MPPEPPQLLASAFGLDAGAERQAIAPASPPSSAPRSCLSHRQSSSLATGTASASNPGDGSSGLPPVLESRLFACVACLCADSCPHRSFVTPPAPSPSHEHAARARPSLHPCHKSAAVARPAY